jgi:hypothetical protein
MRARNLTPVEAPMRPRAHVEHHRLLAPAHHVVELAHADAGGSERPQKAPALQKAIRGVAKQESADDQHRVRAKRREPVEEPADLVVERDPEPRPTPERKALPAES